MPHIEVKLFFPIGRVVDKKSTGTVTFQEELVPGDTLGTLLMRLTCKYPGLKEVFDMTSQKLNPYVLAVLNDIVLSYPHDLGTGISSGDTLSLLPEFAGG